MVYPFLLQYFWFKIDASSHVTFYFSVKINGVGYEIGYREPKEYKVIRLFHEIQEVMVKHGHNEMDMIEISIVLPWTTSRQKKLISNDSELYWVF